MIADNRDVIVALKVHPTLSNLSFSDEKMDSYMELARKYQWPVMVHTANDVVANPIDGLDTYYCNPKGEPNMYGEYRGPLRNKINKEDYDNLMENTARRIFGIK